MRVHWKKIHEEPLTFILKVFVGVYSFSIIHTRFVVYTRFSTHILFFCILYGSFLFHSDTFWYMEWKGIVPKPCIHLHKR